MSLIDIIRAAAGGQAETPSANGVNLGMLQKTSSPTTQQTQFQDSSLDWREQLSGALDREGSSGDAWNTIGLEGILGYAGESLMKKYGTNRLSDFRYLEDPNTPGGYQLDWRGRQTPTGLLGAFKDLAGSRGIVSGGPANSSSDGSPMSSGNPAEALNFGATWEGEGGTTLGFKRDPKTGLPRFVTQATNSNDTADIIAGLAVLGGGIMAGGGLGAIGTTAGATTGATGAATGVAATGTGGAAGSGLYSLGGTGATLGGGTSAGLGLSGTSLGLGGASTGLGITGASTGAGAIGAGIGTTGLAAGTGTLLGGTALSGSLGGGAGAFTGQGMTLGNSGLGLSAQGGAGTALTNGATGMGMTAASPGAAQIGAGLGTSELAAGTGSLLPASMSGGAAPAIPGTPPPANPYHPASYLDPNNLANLATNKVANMGLMDIARMGSSLLGGGGGAGSNLAGIIGGMTDAQRQGDASRKMLEWLNGNQAKMEELYKPGSAEYDQLWQAMSRRDAAAGRNSQYGPRTAQFAAEIAKNRADNIRGFTTGTSRAFSDALNQDAGKYAGLSAAVQRAMGSGRGLDLERIANMLGFGANGQVGGQLTNDQFFNIVSGQGGMPIDYGMGQGSPTEEDVWSWITGGDLGQFF